VASALPKKHLPWEHLLRDGRSRQRLSHSVSRSPSLTAKIAIRNQVSHFLSLRQYGRVEEAGAALNELHRQHPGDLEISFWRAELFIEKQDYSGLENLLQPLRKLPSSPHLKQHIALYDCAILLAENKQEEMHAKLSEIADEPELTSRQRLKIAGYQNQLGQLQESYATCSALCESHPDYNEAWFLKARLLVQMQAYPQAEEVVRYLLELSPSDPKCLILLADIHQKQGRAPKENS